MPANEEWDISSGVGITALMVAATRALETERADRLIDDPYAAVLARAAGPAVPTKATDFAAAWQDTIDYIGLRSRLFDEWFEQSCAAGVRQGVILAAGLDTRAFRLPWPPGFRLFEIDQPKVLAYKDEVLADHGARPGCDRHAVAVDLRDDWPRALRETGFDPSRPTSWLAEGLLPYLPAAVDMRLLEAVHELSVPGSRVAIENLTAKRTVLLDDDFSQGSEKWGVDLNALFSPEARPDPEDRLAGFGWRVRRESIGDASARLGRELTAASRGLTRAGNLLTAELPS
ncbi:SAM-dependent methyltransferase [Saccharopolyspora spinosa]|uniref:S-adenosyl-L-methionine-dependent methyltransferase n=1 Tax=Saccharopolyspora spinosa TaxID=60894 RepID=A0A2N3Y8L8_SACSN|nr:SAM-dependent methyltransferase [Saccharopolyspora spinosa]PKW19258.1 methyltransferase (TIGR00027 family) [Saccharopolyspora spinosa]